MADLVTARVPEDLEPEMQLPMNVFLVAHLQIVLSSWVGLGLGRFVEFRDRYSSHHAG